MQTNPVTLSGTKETADGRRSIPSMVREARGSRGAVGGIIPRSASGSDLPHPGPSGENLVTALAQSKICQEYLQAFSEATGLPLVLQPAGSWQLPHHGSRMENPFCALMAGRSRTCVPCLQSHERLWQHALQGSVTRPCAYGLWETAVPVHLGSQVIGYLHTGQAFRNEASPQQFERTQRLVSRAAPDLDVGEVKAAWDRTPVVRSRRWNSLEALLGIFAQHLSLLSSQLAMQNRHAEAPAITRAREFIEANYSERISLGTVAKVTHTSTFYFCKLFKRVTGVNFTDYVARVRVEKAKNLLFNPNLRISEIAFEVGFQSLTHFNRVFKRVAGQSPSTYRSQLPMA